MTELKRIMITGTSGFLGSRLFNFFTKNGKYQIKCKNDYEVFAPTHQQLDITNGKTVRIYMEEVHPDIVIHSAAISNTWTCEQQPVLSRDVNIIGSVNIGLACRKIGSKMIFMSSDQVYNGEIGMELHYEEETLHPSNIYGKHKLETEQRLMDMGIDVVCLRLTWMFDHPNAGGVLNQNIITNVLHALENREPMIVPIHEYRGITYVREVVKNMEKVLELPCGIYNYGSECNANTYEIVGFVLDAMEKNLDRGQILFPERERYAGQPRNLSMNIEKINKEGIYFANTSDGIKQCIDVNYQSPKGNGISAK
ncbi:MAG: sugar nucleotide-binding protein [Clostridiales bacterium]|nr:sugar nucleotide-binding protein [Clostridiales bacterium]